MNDRRTSGALAGCWKLVSLAMVIGALEGCSRPDGALEASLEARLPPDLLVLPMPPEYPGELAAVQHIHATHGEVSHDLEAYLQISAERVTVVLTMPFGPRLATIEWTAAGIETRRELGLPLADLLRPENVLTDIILAFWPEASLRPWLHADADFLVEHDARLLTYRMRPAVTVRYDSPHPWDGKTEVVNHGLRYRLLITSRLVSST